MAYVCVSNTFIAGAVVKAGDVIDADMVKLAGAAVIKDLCDAGLISPSKGEAKAEVSEETEDKPKKSKKA